MKREFLQNIKVGDQALPKEVIDSIMEEYGRGINAEKAKYADYDTVKSQLDEAQKTINISSKPSGVKNPYGHRSCGIRKGFCYFLARGSNSFSITSANLSNSSLVVSRQMDTRNAPSMTSGFNPMAVIT